jgi:hypothetical protein
LSSGYLASSYDTEYYLSPECLHVASIGNINWIS